MSELEPMAPREGVDLWLEFIQSSRSESTIQSYGYRLNPFVDWCQQEGVENLNDLTSRDIFRFEAERRGDDLSMSSLNNQIGTLKLFLDWCVRVDAVDEGLPQKMEVPTTDEFQEMVNYEKLSESRAVEIREKLHRFARASRRQAMFELLWHTGCRVGGLRSLDLEELFFEADDLERLRYRDDIDEEVLEVVELPFIFFRHRPDSGTGLKNKIEGERPVALNQEVADRVQEYIDINRVPVEDPNGRRPLLTTERGDSARVSTSSIRREIYIVTQPCRFGRCPHGRDKNECEATDHGLESRCPSSHSTHPIGCDHVHA